MSKYSKDCRICRAEQEAEIQQLKMLLSEGSQLYEDTLKELIQIKKQVETAKQYIFKKMTCNCGECWTIDRHHLINILSENFSAEKSSLGETTK